MILVQGKNQTRLEKELEVLNAYIDECATQIAEFKIPTRLDHYVFMRDNGYSEHRGYKLVPNIYIWSARQGCNDLCLPIEGRWDQDMIDLVNGIHPELFSLLQEQELGKINFGRIDEICSGHYPVKKSTNG